MMSSASLSVKTPRKKAKSLKGIALFSGGGGLDLGFEAVGIESLIATDIDSHSCKTLEFAKGYCKDVGKPFFSKSQVLNADALTQLNPKVLLNSLGLKRGEVDVVIGGPPCQAFSVFGKRLGLDDPRAGLAFRYLDLISEIAPKTFVFENVYGLLSIDDGRIFKTLVDRFRHPRRGLYYEISVLRLDAVSYGVPQFRDRVFIVGNIERQTLTVPKEQCWDARRSTSPAHELKPWRTVEDAFRGLPEIGDPFVANHNGRKHSDRIITRYDSLSPGQRDHKTRINRLDLARPSFTIIVGSDKGGGKGHVHPTAPREVTPRESARIQTFPDWWKFSGTSRHPIRQIGNAVPPLLAAVVANQIAHEFFGHRSVKYSELLELLDQGHLFGEVRSETN